MRSSYKIFAGILALVAIVAVAQAAEVTNRGQTFTVNKLSEGLGDQTKTIDLTVPGTQGDRRGIAIATYDFSVHGGAIGTIDISLNDIPKGTILLENAVIEVSTAILPADSTNAIALGGVSILATGTTLNATGIDAAVPTIGVTSADDKIALTISDNAATQGVFTVYAPTVLGNDQ
jgi:hypothetical protein